MLLAMTRLQKEWVSVSFSHYGSLYYRGDVPPPVDDHHCIKNDKVVRDSRFSTIGPDTGRSWYDAGRSTLNVDRGPCAL